MKGKNTAYILEKIANVIIVFENGQVCKFDGFKNFNLDIRQHDDSSLYFETYHYDPKLKENFDNKTDISKVVIVYKAWMENLPDNPVKFTHTYDVKIKEFNMEFDFSNDLVSIELTIRGSFYAK